MSATRSSRVCTCSKFIYECNSLTLFSKATIQLPAKFGFQPTCNLKIFDLNHRTSFRHVCHKREVQPIQSLFEICGVFNSCSCFLNHWPTCLFLRLVCKRLKCHSSRACPSCGDVQIEVSSIEGSRGRQCLSASAITVLPSVEKECIYRFPKYIIFSGADKVLTLIVFKSVLIYSLLHLYSKGPQPL